MAFLYILRLNDNTHYCGITKNIVRRIQDHQKGKSKSTRHKLPLVTKYIKTFESMKAARLMEVKIKKQGVTRWWNKNMYRTDNTI
jgi:putative endonuclease